MNGYDILLKLVEESNHEMFLLDDLVVFFKAKCPYEDTYRSYEEFVSLWYSSNDGDYHYEFENDWFEGETDIILEAVYTLSELRDALIGGGKNDKT